MSNTTESISGQSLIDVLERGRQTDRLGQLIRDALVLIESVLHDLGEEAVGISFNGGKDCTVLLHIYAAVLYARHTSSSSIPSDIRPKFDNSISIPPLPSQPKPITISTPTPTSVSTQHYTSAARSRSRSSSDLGYPPIKSIYITAPNPFPELDRFVLDSTNGYHLDLYRFGGGMRVALENYLNCQGGKDVRGILVGTRKGDPNGDVPTLAMTDPTWPAILRIHPILNWTYKDIWDFLLELNVPYCKLYDQGYTSLGSTTNTSPNPLLRNSSDSDTWDPAWKLQDESQERAGRH